VPFVRCSRDKRGYEYIFLMHASASRRGKPSKPRLLYWFRTPPGVKVGREPFDEAVRRSLEAQHPGIEFDWKKLSDIPAAPPDVEHWRERRRAERAAKQARRGESQPVSTADREADAAADAEESAVPPPDLLVESLPEDVMAAHLEADEEAGDDELEVESEAPPALAQPETPSAAQTPGERAPGARRRRRRGGRRRRHRPGGTQPAEGAAIQLPEAARDEQSGGESSKSPDDSSKVE
jgi:hypothetical protein